MAVVVVRVATIDDAPLILGFVRALARYEKAEHEVLASVDDIRHTLFSASASAYALICEIDGQAAGFAVYFFNYSTWQGRNGLYLEDLYIDPSFRGQGGGRALFAALARIAIEHDCGRFEWSVLDWNQPSIDFYESLGAQAKSEWLGYRLEREQFAQLAAMDVAPSEDGK